MGMGVQVAPIRLLPVPPFPPQYCEDTIGVKRYVAYPWE